MDIEYNGVPYIHLRYQEYHCHQGRDMNTGLKYKKPNVKNEEIMTDHCYRETRKLTQPSKIMGCPVVFAPKKIFYFPEFSISKDTKRHITEASKLLKEYLSNRKKSYDTVVINTITLVEQLV